MQKNLGEQGVHGIAESTDWHNVAVVGPTHHGHVAGHEARQEYYAKPDRGIEHRESECLRQTLSRKFDGPEVSHAALEQEVAHVRAQNHDQDHEQGPDPNLVFATHSL